MDIRKLVSFMLCALSISAIAGPGTGPVKLKAVKVESGYVYLTPTNSISNPLFCGLASPIKLEPNDAGYKEMYSASLTALASGKTISFWLRSCVISPWGKTVPKAYAISISAN